jgi:hypothetical protein
MIFVIDFSCLSRGPDDQGLSCGHREPSSSRKGLSEAARSGSKSGEKGEKASPLRGAGGMLAERVGYGSGGRIGRRRTAPGSHERAVVHPNVK